MAKTKLQQYADIQPLVQKEARDIAKKVYKEETDRSKYKVPQVPFHTHNGSDSALLKQGNLIKVNGFACQLTQTESETFYFVDVPSDISNLTVNGIAYNNSGVSPSERSIVNGQAFFSRTYYFSGSGTRISLSNLDTTPTTGTGVNGRPFYQVSNGMTIEDGGTTDVRVFTAPSLVYILDVSGALAIKLQIISVSPGVIEIEATVNEADGWVLVAHFTFN